MDINRPFIGGNVAYGVSLGDIQQIRAAKGAAGAT